VLTNGGGVEIVRAVAWLASIVASVSARRTLPAGKTI
jgi:hypothetical protein